MQEPEKRLILAVISNAINDAMRNIPGNKASQVVLNKQMARMWLFSKSKDTWGFFWCLEQIGSDHLYNDIVKKLKKGEINLKNIHQYLHGRRSQKS